MKTINKFTGFSPDTFQFFAGLEENNYKPWFDEHKPIYELEVLQPLKALAVALTPFFYNVDSEMDFRPNRMISRIYRDIRFSPDKTPYKKHLWISFQRPFQKQTGDWASFPGFYMEIGKEGGSFGMGMFEAQKKVMDRFRDQVEYEPEHFKSLTAELTDKHNFTIGGEEYKRPVKNELDAYFQPWIQRKGIYLTKYIPINEIFYSDKLISYMEQEFALLQPLYDFFVNVCD
jgi:uncharacterized protein (TIGR02453 family)